MRTYPASLPVFLVFLVVFSAVYLYGTAGVPFHPDESSYIYTSADVELFLRQPSALFWRAENGGDARQTYRELNPPLINVFIALGCRIAGEPPISTDWNWSATWLENFQSGALPSPRLLLASRLAVAILYPLSLLFLFLTIYRIANEFTAWTGVILLATNALALLHTRRAMAEGILLFTSILTMWALVRTEKQRWLISIPATLAFCAKQTLAPLLPIGLVAVLWSAEEVQHSRWKTTGKQALYFSTTVLALLLLMHPFVWSQPLRALQASIQARQSLAARQTADRPEQTLNTTERKLVSMISNLYLNPPVFAETRNYTAETYSSEQAYLTNPLHSLFRSIPAGGTLLVLNLFGFITGILRAIRKKPAAQRRMVLILAATILQTIALFVLIPLPWQRYYLPLIPYTCLWTAFGIDQLRQAIDPTKKTQPL